MPVSRFVVALCFTMLIGNNGLCQMTVAHRGASKDAPENTIAAFELAWEQGADGIEGDFYLTKDKKIVCIHDSTTKRTAKRSLNVEGATLQQLRELEYGSWKEQKFLGEPIPTLEDVLHTVPNGKTFVIELKSKASIVPVLATELQRLFPKNDHHIEILIISFDQETIATCKNLIPNIPAHWLARFDKKLLRHPPTAKQIANAVQRIGANGVGMQANRKIIDQDFIATLLSHGCNEFHVWTVDDIDDAIYFRDLGAIGITTNVPALVGPALRVMQLEPAN